MNILGPRVFGLFLSLALLPWFNAYANDRSTPSVEPIISLPSGHFFENLTYINDEELIATDYTGMSLYKYDVHGQSSLWAKVPGHPVSVRFNEQGAGLLAVHETSIMAGESFAHSMALFGISPQGELSLVKRLDFPAFLNGMAYLGDNQYLIADALNGKIYRFDASTTQLSTWYSNEILEPDSERPGLPGVNGIQYYNGTLYLTNSAKKLLAEIPLASGKAASARVIHVGIQADDFIIDPQGNWYLTTHHEEIIKFTPDGEVSVLVEKGLEGNTAIQMSRKSENIFYVTNDGGLLFGSKSSAGLNKVSF